MAHSLSSKKRIRQNEKRRVRNRGRKSVLKSALRETREAVTTGAADAETKVRELAAQLDALADRRTIHKNAAARRKSRLMKRLNASKTKAG